MAKTTQRVKCVGMCVRELTANSTNFFRSNREEDKKAHDGYAPLCKQCVKKMIVDEFGKTNVHLFKKILKTLDVVFIPRIYEEALIKHCDDHSKVLGEYRSILSSSEGRSERFIDSAKYEYQTMMATKVENIEITEEMLEFWGTEIVDPRLYHIYQKEFDRLCIYDGGEINSVKESYFKNIAILTHTSQQQLLQGQLKEYDTTMKVLTTICEKCGINPKQVQDKDDSNRGTYGVFIKMIEEEEPIEDWNKMMGSVDMVRRVLEVFFFGHLAEVMGFRNPLKCRYDEEIGEYSVKVDTWEDLANIEEEEEVEAKGFRRIFKARRDKSGKLVRRLD